jgi:hypothetical protein
LEYLKEAFSILDPEVNAAKSDKVKSDVENISQNLYVQCAEVAINVYEINFLFNFNLNLILIYSLINLI